MTLTPNYQNCVRGDGDVAVEVTIIQTSTCNLGSISDAMKKVGADVTFSSNPEIIKNAKAVVFPGVSSFGSAMQDLRAVPCLCEALKERIAMGKPTLLVCVGIQILCKSSEEDADRKNNGLGIVDLTVQRLPVGNGVKIPQQGWNRVQTAFGYTRCNILQSGFAYFTNAFALRSTPLDWAGAVAEFGGFPFVAGLEKDGGRVVAVQFHPELSGAYGADLLKRWVAQAGAYARNETKNGGLLLKSHTYRRIIPCLDCKDGRVVKGIQFHSLKDCGDPVEVAKMYERQDADELCMLDISATPDGRKTCLDIVRKIKKEISIALTVGGGVKSVEDAAKLLEAGADKVAVNSAAVRNPQLITDLAERFGRQCVVLAIDAKTKADSSWEVVIQSGSQVVENSDVVSWAKQGVELGCGEILLTSFDRDGTKRGYDLDLCQKVSEAVSVPVIASGGAENAHHMYDALVGGKVDAVLAASILHSGETTVRQLKSEIAVLGKKVGHVVSFRDIYAPPSLKTKDTRRQNFIPSIDILNGEVVQLVGGNPEHEGRISCGNPLDMMEKFALFGEVAVVDLDAALGTPHGSNKSLIMDLCQQFPGQCRVGGGIRDYELGKEYLDAGASKIIIGTRATIDFLSLFPKGRVIVALDNKKGKLVVDGWRTYENEKEETTDDPYKQLLLKMETLRDYCDGFLVTFVENEGRMTGISDEKVEMIRMMREVGKKLTVAGGITTSTDLKKIDGLGCEAQVGMALYQGHISLPDCLILNTDRRDGLYPTIVSCDRSGLVLGFCYSSQESLREAISTRTGVYWSRSRNELWRKGSTSGNTQKLKRVFTDCDRDAVLFVVEQKNGFCHRNDVVSCFGNELVGLDKLEKTILARIKELKEIGPEKHDKSYVYKLLRNPSMLKAKILEEAQELCGASSTEEHLQECADVLFFALTKMIVSGGSLKELGAVLDKRSFKITKRPGLAKEAFLSKVEELENKANADTKEHEAEAGETPFSFPILSPDDAKAKVAKMDPVDDEALLVARTIFTDIKKNGQDALRKIMLQFNEIAYPDAPLTAGKEEMQAAFEALPKNQQDVLTNTAARIRQFAESQMACIQTELSIPLTNDPLLVGGHAIKAVQRAGCYAPCGQYPLPSSVLMTCIPAKVAGVEEVILATPCATEESTKNIMLAAAFVAQVDRVLLAGGAQAICALASGTAIPPCHAIVGPGNRFVTAAKSLVAGSVAIDFLAGPSEVVVLCDETANADTVAKDLLAQAEHDACARSILVSTSVEKIHEVESCLAAALANLKQTGFVTNHAVAQKALKNNAFAVFCSSVEAAIGVCDCLAPEHLEIQTKNPEDLARKCQNYGALFTGEQAAEVFGDYGAGPNHCLPTGGTAKSFGGLSVFTFLRIRTFMKTRTHVGMNYGGQVIKFRDLQENCATLARMEGLECHARAATVRKVHAQIVDSPQVAETLKWGVPKGRMFDNLVKLLQDANIDIHLSERGLRPIVKSMPHWDFKLLKPQSIGEMLAQERATSRF